MEERAKVFWLGEGDPSSHSFHNSIKKKEKQQNYQASRQKWELVGKMYGSVLSYAYYFQKLFNSAYGNVAPILNCIEGRISHFQIFNLPRL